jgi:hypothetical protein
MRETLCTAVVVGTLVKIFQHVAWTPNLLALLVLGSIAYFVQVTFHFEDR